jgi:SAM-dependent methyltransferase
MTCYNCESELYTNYATENGFSLVKCCNCGLLYLQNPPKDDEISQSHKQGKHSGVKELDVTGSFNSGKIPKYLDLLQKLFNEGLPENLTWLDIGCGHGEFMMAVQKYSNGKVLVKGTEPNTKKQKSAQSRGLDVSFFDIAAHESKYDIISLLNVYSHLPNPPLFIESLKKLLNPGGQIVLETGDTANLSAQEHYKPFYLPDHLSFASESIVINILERLDFKVLSVIKYPYLSSNPKALVKEVVKLFLPQYHSQLRYYLSWKLYSQTDMFIKAKLKN